MRDYDWSKHPYDKPIEVELAVRPQFMGRPALPECVAQNGQKAAVCPMWRMDDGDPYPGEFALAGPHCEDVFGRSWIASGDVRVCKGEA